MEKAFCCLCKKNLTINPKKCELLKDKITYIGHKLSANGVSLDKVKIDTITALHSLQNIKELKLFLGMITKIKFMPKFATITDPLCQLLKKGVIWT